jgi:hypothetical protein
MYRVGSALVVIAVVGLVVGLTSDVPEHPSITEDQREFIGTARCKTCHRKPEQGEQFRIWEESAHSKAFATLASEESKAIAAEKGIDDPQTADECLKCHVTAHGVAEEFLGRKYDIADGVGCESCHGAGGDYYKKKTMTALYNDEMDAASVGLVEPTAETCMGCHNEESPTFKGFDFDEMYAKIAHPIPEGGSGDSGDDEG